VRGDRERQGELAAGDLLVAAEGLREHLLRVLTATPAAAGQEQERNSQEGEEQQGRPNRWAHECVPLAVLQDVLHSTKRAVRERSIPAVRLKQSALRGFLA